MKNTGVVSLIFFGALSSVNNATAFKIEPLKMVADAHHGGTHRWRHIQDQARDTVVQIFSHIAEIDLLEPHRAPNQRMVCGSGFFINDQGYIVTNAHVVNQAIGMCAQIPSLGKRLVRLGLVSICPDRDLALLRVVDEDIVAIRRVLGTIPFLTLGDSDRVHRADEVLALGYPLGQESLKSTTGVISGRERNMIQMSAPINPGSSGGPLLNSSGEVVGINSAGIVEAQNVGYIIPINDLRVVLADMLTVPLLRKPFLGLLTTYATDSLTAYLNNPAPGGCYVLEVVKNSPLSRAGVMRGDMIYEVNGNKLDIYGEMIVPWSEDKISIIEFISRLRIGDVIELVIYRSGERKEITITVDPSDLPAIRRVYPGYEKIDYEIFAGMIIMELTMNHIDILMKYAPGLLGFTEVDSQANSVLVITHMFHNSMVYNSRVIQPGIVVKAINDTPVHNLDELRTAIREHGDEEYFVMRCRDTVTRTSENLMIALPFDRILQEEYSLARDYRYQISPLVDELLQMRD